MSKDISLPDPERFGISSFAEILTPRVAIVGEEPGSFDVFHEMMMQDLAPLTPYECVIAENLIAIEWELLQLRRMRDARLRQAIGEIITDAIVKLLKAAHASKCDEAWSEHVKAGGSEQDWREPFEFDEDAARVAGEDLAARAVSRDHKVQTAAYAEIMELGREPVQLMAFAYSRWMNLYARHDAKFQELERRRREVKRDFDGLQKARPLEVEVIKG